MIEHRTTWRSWVTPKPLKDKPIHRWYTFPHSFTAELAEALIAEWGLKQSDRILDPFVGAGTTILAAKQNGIPGTGYDLSPFAAFVSTAKTTNYSRQDIIDCWTALLSQVDLRTASAKRQYPELVRQALPGRILSVFEAIDDGIYRADGSPRTKRFLRLALLSLIPEYSRATPTGGWLKWSKAGGRSTSILRSMERRLADMLGDLDEAGLPGGKKWRIGCADARSIPDSDSTYTAVITSPPYPNRHDYTRVFGIELMFGFLNWEETRQLRYQSFHSHPESRPERTGTASYREPARLTKTLQQLEAASADCRIIKMLRGYFLDMYLCLREMKRVTHPGARLAVVLGNAQYNGYQILVDELTAEIGESTGLTCASIRAVRYRGNSAQQMRIHGRVPSRESIIIFRHPIYTLHHPRMCAHVHHGWCAV